MKEVFLPSLSSDIGKQVFCDFWQKDQNISLIFPNKDTEKLLLHPPKKLRKKLNIRIGLRPRLRWMRCYTNVVLRHLFLLIELTQT